MEQYASNRGGIVEQKSMYRMEKCWQECLETLNLSETQSFQIAGIPSAPSLLHLEYYHADKLLRTFNLSAELLESGQVCHKTLIRQFRGEVAFSQRGTWQSGFAARSDFGTGFLSQE